MDTTPEHTCEYFLDSLVEVLENSAPGGKWRDMPRWWIIKEMQAGIRRALGHAITLRNDLDTLSEISCSFPEAERQSAKRIARSFRFRPVAANPERAAAFAAASNARLVPDAASA